MLALTREITQCPNVILDSGRTPDGNCVAILKSQWWEPPNAVALRKNPSNMFIRGTGIVRDRVCQRIMQDCQEPGARIFGINIDRVTTERGKCHFRRAKSRTPRHGDIVRFQQLREHLAQQIRFPKWLGCNDHRPVAMVRIGFDARPLPL